MVKCQGPSLDRIFAALADPTRRALLARLGERPGLSVSELARPFPVSLPAIMKHLDVLAEAGLVLTPQGRNERAPGGNLTDWVRHHDRYEDAAAAACCG